MKLSFELTDGDRVSGVWTKLYAYFNEELEHARLMLENPTSVEPADVTRGRIKTLRSLIRLNETKPIVE